MKITPYEENAMKALKAAGYRITMPRTLVVRALADSEIALTVYQLHDRIVASGGKIDVVSVYRILDVLQAASLVHKVGMLDGAYVRRELPPPPNVVDRVILAVDVERRTVQQLHEGSSIRELNPIRIQNEIQIRPGTSYPIPGFNVTTDDKGATTR